jgi:hypothetical protein
MREILSTCMIKVLPGLSPRSLNEYVETENNDMKDMCSEWHEIIEFG